MFNFSINVLKNNDATGSNFVSGPVVFVEKNKPSIIDISAENTSQFSRIHMGEEK